MAFVKIDSFRQQVLVSGEVNVDIPTGWTKRALTPVENMALGLVRCGLAVTNNKIPAIKFLREQFLDCSLGLKDAKDAIELALEMVGDQRRMAA